MTILYYSPPAKLQMYISELIHMMCLVWLLKMFTIIIVYGYLFHWCVCLMDLVIVHDTLRSAILFYAEILAWVLTLAEHYMIPELFLSNHLVT